MAERESIDLDGGRRRSWRPTATPGWASGTSDVQLLAPTQLDARLWTRDRRLAVAAERLGVADRSDAD